MKKDRHYLIKSFMLVVLAGFMYSGLLAQEEKEEQVIKIKMVKNEDGSASLDTTITITGDFDGDWKALIDDEELLEDLEELKFMFDSDGKHENIMIMSPSKEKHAYMYVTAEEGEDGQIRIEVKESDEGIHDIYVKKFDGDSTMTYTIKTAGGGKDGEKKVMVWHSDGEGEFDHDVLLEKIEGDSVKYIVITSDEDCDKAGVVKEKEVIIIKDGKVVECEHYNKKEKEKKKKKKK